jgi:hypothetical protein
MVDDRDPGTLSMPLEVKRGRGRPRKADALTPAQRAARYRAKRLLQAGYSADQVDDLIAQRDEALARARELTAVDRDVTKIDADSLCALASLAGLLRRYSRDPGAIVKPRTFANWARTLEYVVGQGRD